MVYIRVIELMKNTVLLSTIISHQVEYKGLEVFLFVLGLYEGNYERNCNQPSCFFVKVDETMKWN